MNKTIKDLQDIIAIHSTQTPFIPDGCVSVRIKDLANYLYGIGYRKSKVYCKWKRNANYNNVYGYDTDCKQFIPESILHGMIYKYCQYCGKKIKVVKSK